MGKKRICIILSVLMILSAVFPTDLSFGNTAKVYADEVTEEVPQAQSETASPTETPVSTATEGKLRLIFTTDIHGQVTSYDYQTGKSVNKGLDKIYTMINTARGQVNKNNYLTFDLGDSIMDFNSDYIYAQDSTALQPVYKAMTLIDYDAITLGNHEFDYSYDYAVNQMNMSGLMSKCVLSNVYSSINGETAFGVENKIIEKQLTDSYGRVLNVKVGIIGETVPSLSTRTEAFKNKLATEDIVENTKKQAASLKQQGADIIVVLAHSGFGTENPAARSANVNYALTKISDVDVVLGGHEHIDFPSADKNDIHYSLPNIDKQTGLVNGKRLVMIRDSCRGLGVVDLNLKLNSENKVVVDNSSYEIRKVTSDIISNQEICNTMSEWDAKLKAYCQNSMGTIADGVNWNNYSAPLESNEIIQTVHNAQIDYASNYIVNNAAEYANTPIVSVTRYTKYGSEGGSDYSDLTGNLVEGNVDSIANYHRYVYIYKVTGAQLREWIEWSASIYQTAYTSDKKNWNNLVIADYVDKEKGDSLLQEEFLSEWNRFFQFDGVEYTINPSVEPRYNYDGEKINNTNRVTSLTRNGVSVQDSDTFVVVTDKITDTLNVPATNAIREQIISKSHVILQDIVKSYLISKSAIENINMTVNRNWTLELPEGYKFMLVSGKSGQDRLLSKEWCNSVYSSIADFNYYSCKFISDKWKADTAPPAVVLSLNNKAETNKTVSVRVIASDKSGIGQKKYIYGNYNKDSEVWNTDAVSGGAIDIYGDTFEADKSGVYSVRVTDGAGNVTVEKIAVTNIYPEILVKPMVNKIDNNDTKVKGTADPSLIVVVDVGSRVYSGNVGVDGQFSVSIPCQKASKKISVYVEDSQGRTSNSVTLTVKRVGPNCPTITNLKNNKTVVSGNTGDGPVKVYAVIDDKAYVSESLGADYYLKSKGYDPGLSVNKVPVTVKNNGSYSITIPNQYANTEVRVFSVDNIGRVSHARKRAVQKEAPNRATIFQASDVERYVYGYIPDAQECKVAVKVGNNIYRGRVQNDDFFAVKVGKLNAGDVMSVYGYETTDEGVKRAYIKTHTVESAKTLYSTLRQVEIHIDKVTDKSTQISGKYTEADTKIYVCINGKEYITTTDENGKYSVKISSRPKIGDTVYVLTRSTRGAIKGMRKFATVLGAPVAPVIVGRPLSTSKYAKVYTKEPCKVTLKIGANKYVMNTGKYDSSTGRYYYIFSIKKPKAGAKIRVWARNSAGSTKGVIKTVKKAK